MNHSLAKFPDSIRLQITIGKRKKLVECELASSSVEIMLSLNNRISIENPMVLYFDNPLIQSFSRQKFKISVEQICVDYKTNLVKRYSVLNPSKYKGDFIQSYSEFSMVILSPIGFFSKGLIVENKTIITPLNFTATFRVTNHKSI
jgi:hypothetical protein